LSRPGSEIVVPRSAFTLMELVLVMFLMAVALSFAVPALDSLWNPNQVVASIDTVRSMWMEGRNRAMEEGRPYRYSVETNGAQYRLEPDDADDNSQQDGTRIEGQLPTPCIFVESPDVLRATGLPQTLGEFKAVAVFLPDGTARDDVTLYFGRIGMPAATLKLRALTGTISQDMSGKEKLP